MFHVDKGIGLYWEPSSPFQAGTSQVGRLPQLPAQIDWPIFPFSVCKLKQGCLSVVEHGIDHGWMGKYCAWRLGPGAGRLFFLSSQPPL